MTLKTVHIFLWKQSVGLLLFLGLKAEFNRRLYLGGKHLFLLYLYVEIPCRFFLYLLLEFVFKFISAAQ